MAKTIQKNHSVPMKTKQKPRTFASTVMFAVFNSLPIRVFAVGLLYASGYWNINPIWLIFVWGLFQYRNQKRREHHFNREKAEAIAKRDEDKIVLSNVDPLPSWVDFPDTERCEWLNKAVKHLWPTIQSIVLVHIKELEPTFNNVMSKYKNNPNFCFEKVSIGSLTPRVSGVRVYDRDVTRSDRSIVDTHIYFVSDSVFYCSIMNSITFGCDNFELKGCLRTIVSTPASSYFPGVEVFFLQQPTLDLNLTGVLSVADMPGMSGMIRNTVDGVIANKLVLPNKFVIHYDDRVDIEQLTFPDPEGLLTVNVIEARALGGPLRPNNPNPFVTITFGSKTFTSPTINDSIHPVWNYTAEFIVDSFIDETITLSVDEEVEVKNTMGGFSDDDDPFLDDTVPGAVTYQKHNLGKLSFSLKLVEDKIRFNSWIQLEGVKSGMVNLRVSYCKLENNPELSTSNNLPAVLEVLIEDAKNLAKVNDKVVAEISVGDDKQTSKPVPINKPVFREVFAFFVKNPKTDKLRVKLINVNNEKGLGDMEFDIKQLLEANNMEVINEQAEIKGANETSRLSLSMRLRAMRS